MHTLTDWTDAASSESPTMAKEVKTQFLVMQKFVWELP